jgi:uncharacterized protein (TIGR02391 family)
MTVSRPIGKQILKNLFLKLMATRKQGVKAQWELENTFPKMLEINGLERDERDAAHQGINDLVGDRLIMQDPQAHGQDGVYILTDRGKKLVADNGIDKMGTPKISIDELISRDDLRNIVREDFCSGRYEVAVQLAFRLLEESVRKVAGQTAGDVGVSLMSTAFKSKGGLLIHPEAATDSEIEGLHQLMRGAIALFKNPSSHRTVSYQDEHHAAHILGLANLLLDLLFECKPV